MTERYDEEISLSGKMFAGLRSQADEVIRVMLTNMQENQLDDGETVIRIKAKLERECVPDPMGRTREIVVPVFQYTASSVLKTECKTTGGVGGNYELVYDEEADRFVRRPVDDGQACLFGD